MGLSGLLLKYEQFMKSNKGDKIGIVSTLCLIFMVTFNSLIALIYQINDPNSSSGLWVFFLGVFLLFNVLGNMFMAIRQDTTIDSINLPTILLPEWRYCSFCEQNAPPRCFHCFTCNKCVLKRHNHCMFLGKCAGHKNLRFYLIFILYVWLGICLTNFVHLDYYLDVFVYQPSFQKVFITIMPLFGLMVGMISLVDFVFIFINSITLILFPMIFLYMLMNYKMAMCGQTWHENAKNIRVYDMGCLQNLLEIFGSNWFVAFFYPFVRLQLASDGTRFRTNDGSIKYQNVNVENASFDGNQVRRRENNTVYNY